MLGHTYVDLDTATVASTTWLYVLYTTYFTYTWRSGAAGACVDPGFLGVASLWRPRDAYCEINFFEDGEYGTEYTRNHGCIMNNSSNTYDSNHNSKQIHIQHPILNIQHFLPPSKTPTTPLTNPSPCISPTSSSPSKTPPHLQKHTLSNAPTLAFRHRNISMRSCIHRVAKCHHISPGRLNPIRRRVGR